MMMIVMATPIPTMNGHHFEPAELEYSSDSSSVLVSTFFPCLPMFLVSSLFTVVVSVSLKILLALFSTNLPNVVSAILKEHDVFPTSSLAFIEKYIDHGSVESPKRSLGMMTVNVAFSPGGSGIREPFRTNVSLSCVPLSKFVINSDLFRLALSSNSSTERERKKV